MMRKKIYFIHLFMQPGGVERQLYYLANGLAGYHDVTVLLCERKGSFLDFIDQRVSVLALDTPYKHRLQLGLLAGMIKIMKKDRPDVLISFHGNFHWLAVIVGKLLRIKVVCVFPGYMTSGLLWPAHRFILHLADGLIAVSHSVKNSMIENLRIREHKIAVIENAIDPAKIRKMAEEPLTSIEQRYFDGGNIIISIGRLAKGKGFDVLLRALSGIREKCTLLILGDGPEKGTLETDINRLNLSDRAFLLGNQANPYKFLKRAAFFVLASESEGLPTVILEAMCLGIPCICTKYRGGTEGVITHKETGYLVEANNPDELNNAINLFLSSESRPMLDNIAEAGKVLTERKFCLNRYANQYMGYLDGL